MKPFYTYIMGGAPHRLYFKPSREALTLMRQSYNGREDWRARASEQARLYARWLAQRDGIDLPAVGASSGFICNWEGNRIQSVTFTCGRRNSRGEFTHADAIATIELPNWDFQPTCRQIDDRVPAKTAEHMEGLAL